MISKIQFDKFRVEEDFDKRIVFYRWYLKDELVKELFQDQAIRSSRDWCPACGYWRAELVELTKDDVYSDGKYLYYKCPKCKGLIGKGLEAETICSCASIPHRISCEMGIKLYMSYCRPLCSSGIELKKFNPVIKH